MTGPAKRKAESEAERIDWFFRKPADGDPAGARRSNLFVLRRDLCDLICEEGSVTQDLKAPMLAAIGMLSGIDLMAWTVVWPKENPGRMDFVSFLIKYGGMLDDEAQALYQYRCAQVHSYGLFAIQKKKDGTRIEFTFTLDPSERHHKAILPSPTAKYPHNFTVSLFPLRALFLKAIDNFESAVKSDLSTRAVFLSAIEKIGFFHIQSGWSV